MLISLAQYPLIYDQFNKRPDRQLSRKPGARSWPCATIAFHEAGVAQGKKSESEAGTYSEGYKRQELSEGRNQEGECLFNLILEDSWTVDSYSIILIVYYMMTFIYLCFG